MDDWIVSEVSVHAGHVLQEAEQRSDSFEEGSEEISGVSVSEALRAGITVRLTRRSCCVDAGSFTVVPVLAISDICSDLLGVPPEGGVGRYVFHAKGIEILEVNNGETQEGPPLCQSCNAPTRTLLKGGWEMTRGRCCPRVGKRQDLKRND